jgi:hypothetical protein
VKLWFDNGNDVFMAERLAMSWWLHSPMRQRQSTQRQVFRKTIHLCVFLFFNLVAVSSEGTCVRVIGIVRSFQDSLQFV